MPYPTNNYPSNIQPDTRPESLKAALARLTFFIHNFEHSYKELGEIRGAYRGSRLRFMKPKIRHEFKEAKKDIRHFNDALRDVIENSGDMTFNELMDFLATAYTTAHGESPNSFINHARDTLIGARNEVAFEQILTTAGIKFDKGTDQDDARGGDVLIEDVRIDTKTSWLKTERTKASARARGYNPDRIIWSHINQEDYDGKLTLPLYKLRELAKKVQPDVERAVASVHPGRKIA